MAIFKYWKTGLFAGLATVALSGCVLIGGAVANLIETSEFKADGPNLFMNGVINRKSPGQFSDAVTEMTTTLVLCDVPGSALDSATFELGSRVREMGLNTYLTSTSNVESGGSDLFLAGVERRMEQGARMGVHAWTDGIRDGQDVPADSGKHDDGVAFYEAMLGTADFYWFVLSAARNSGMYFVTEKDIVDYGLVTDTSLEQSEIACPN